MVFVEDDVVEPAVRDGRPLRAQRRTDQRRGEPQRTAATAAEGWQTARCANGGEGTSRSIGRATSGSLDDGCELPHSAKGYRCGHHARWGTERTVAIVQWAARELIRIHPSDGGVVIGALSREGGGRLGGHSSHQSGRDVDIGYLGSSGSMRQFEVMTGSNLDIERSWTLIGALLHTGEVVYLFMDYNLQARFHRYLDDEGVDAETLARIFQYPAGRGARRGIIRHASGHGDHFHVRFRCPPDENGACID